jgi:DNA-binding response OmpR family regulator
VADDSAVVLDVVSKRVVASGFEAVRCASAAAARAVDAKEIACALLDIDLGDGTGAEVARALRATRPELPIAFFSAGAPVEDARVFGPVFVKPAELDEAIRWVAAHMAGTART